MELKELKSESQVPGLMVALVADCACRHIEFLKSEPNSE